MNELKKLSERLRANLVTADVNKFTSVEKLDGVIKSLQKHNNAGSGPSVPRDLLQEAVRKFWEKQQFETLRDARLVSFGLCVPGNSYGVPIMEDRRRFLAVLDDNTGVGQWGDAPRWYRRCYQGLMRSYFTYDAKVKEAPDVGKKNWGDLRDYLQGQVHNITDQKNNPDWVTLTLENQQLFGDSPCSPYADEVLSGDMSTVDHICENLGILKSSWFHRELVFAQIQQATELKHEHFKELIPRLLKLLSENLVLRDKGLILLLDKYASAAHLGVNEPLRNASVEWWGNPWLPSNETRWGGVAQATRQMVSEWLKREFVEAFFTKLAQDGIGDKRRAHFWLRYVKSMDNIQFALGTTALNSRDPDLQVLRKKMAGLYTELKTTDRSNNAFIMTLGNLVAVEFGGMGNAFYGYDTRESLPFNASLPVQTALNVRNSLKHQSCILKMSHKDGIKGFRSWEDMFEATLRLHFGIRPQESTYSSVRRSQPDNSSKSRGSRGYFNRNNFDEFTKRHGLKVDDLTPNNGNLWVRMGDFNVQVTQVLKDWGFRYKPGKGWWR
ncbi:MAG: EH signature domain-containing protein [Desulfobulbus sp.]